MCESEKPDPTSAKYYGVHGFDKRQYDQDLAVWRINKRAFAEADNMDYPAAARSIALWLKPYCDESLPYPAMIAEAARMAAKTIEETQRDHANLSKHNKDIIADLNAQRNQLRFKDKQVKDLKEKLGEAVRDNSLLRSKIEELKEDLANKKAGAPWMGDLWVYEQDLPPLTVEEYAAWYKLSKVIDGVRMGPNPDLMTNEDWKEAME